MSGQTFPPFFAVAGRDRPGPARRPAASRTDRLTPWLVAFFAAVVAAAFFADVGVPTAPAQVAATVSQ